LCNPDVQVIDAVGLKQAIRFLASHPKVGCLIPSLVDMDGVPTPSCREFYDFKSLLASRAPSWLLRFLGEHKRPAVYNDCLEPFETDWGSGSALLFKASLFPNPISFDERFFLYCEDVDFCARIWKSGHAVMSYPTWTMRHDGQHRSKAHLRFLCYHVHSLLKFIWKYRGLPKREDLKNGTAGQIRQAVAKRFPKNVAGQRCSADAQSKSGAGNQRI
jgi:GT2 family glycosyltransferase